VVIADQPARDLLNNRVLLESSYLGVAAAGLEP
jgi:hypothetical protein